jgi:alkanesulfonate monooxygenase SsuD/methylene tetrahydromethanopterin reductase-like flavin-dependent oxidoreductase (luciferase family)
MEVGVQLLYQNTHDGMSDAEMLRRETDIAVLAEEVGMDFVQAPEHHFDPGYCMMPDNMQWCAYMAARTSRITIGTGAIILPWWDNPTRVAEKIAMLEILLGDRFMLGLGRGLAKKEYEAFGVAMSDARERFDTSSELILEMLKTGIAEYDTPQFKQSRVEIHPWQPVDWRERGFNSVAMSPDSGIAAANIGGTMMSFVQLPWEQHHEAVEAWRARFEEVHPGKDPGAPIFSDFTFCHDDPKVAEDTAREWLSKYYLTVIKHYDFDGSHWGDTQGYTAYQAGADAIREAGLEAAAEGFVQSQLWGTPEEIIEGWSKRVETTGELRAAMGVSYAGMPFEQVEESLRLIGEKVVPELHKISAKSGAAA